MLRPCSWRFESQFLVRLGDLSFLEILRVVFRSMVPQRPTTRFNNMTNTAERVGQQGLIINGIAVIDRNGRFPNNSFLSEQSSVRRSNKPTGLQKAARIAGIGLALSPLAIALPDCGPQTTFTACGNPGYASFTEQGFYDDVQIEVADSHVNPSDQLVEKPTQENPQKSFTAQVDCGRYGKSTLTGSIAINGDICVTSSNPQKKQKKR